VQWCTRRVGGSSGSDSLRGCDDGENGRTESLFDVEYTRCTHNEPKRREAGELKALESAP
jgi:hypothetical protein